jgi:hypothetical protein
LRILPGSIGGVLGLLARLEHRTNLTRDPHSGESPWTPRLQVFDVHKESIKLVDQILQVFDILIKWVDQIRRN